MSANGCSSMEQCKKIAKNWLHEQINTGELFICAICHDAISVSHPVHCPRCSKLFCAGCMAAWFKAGTGNSRSSIAPAAKRCPYCQATVSLSQFSFCRVYQEVRELVDGLQNNMDQLVRQLTKPVVLCEKHNKELTLFCQECHECICVKCILVDRHRGHVDLVLELDDAREKLKTLVIKENNFLVNRLAALNEAATKQAARENDLHRSFEAKIEEVRKAYEAIVNSLYDERDDRIRKQIAPVKASTKRLQEEAEAAIQQTAELVSEETGPAVVVKTYQMIQTIRKMHYGPFPVDQVPDTTFINPLTPPPQKIFEGFMLQLKGYHDAGEDLIKLSLRILKGYDVNDIKVVCYPRGAVGPLVRRMDLKKGEDNTALEFDNFTAMGGFLDRKLDELTVDMKLHLWRTYYEKCAHKDWYIQQLNGFREVMDNTRQSC